MSNTNKIDCSVQDCIYHDKANNCTAEHVKVGQCSSNTTECDDTQCSTFRLDGNTRQQKSY